MSILLLTALLGQDALASGDPARMPTVHVLLVHAVSQDHPWGVRAGVDLQLALGDHCGYREEDCRPQTGWGSLWPVGGPAASLTWRGGDRFALDLALELGIGALEVHHYGFMPLWEVLGRVGLRFELPGPVAGFVLGGFASKSFSPRFYVPDGGGIVRGTDGAGLRLDTDAMYEFDVGWRAPTVGGGPWMVAGSAGTLY